MTCVEGDIDRIVSCREELVVLSSCGSTEIAHIGCLNHCLGSSCEGMVAVTYIIYLIEFVRCACIFV